MLAIQPLVSRRLLWPCRASIEELPAEAKENKDKDEDAGSVASATSVEPGQDIGEDAEGALRLTDIRACTACHAALRMWMGGWGDNQAVRGVGDRQGHNSADKLTS
jgi:hypothetical protein